MKSKYKFMSFKKGQGRWANIAIIVAMVGIAFRAGAAKAAGVPFGGKFIGTLTTTSSSTIAGQPKYLAPIQSQDSVVIRKSVGLYTNRG